MSNGICTHIGAISEIKIARELVCAACIESGSRWVHLRTCQACGVTLCCDSSPEKHMTQHFQQTGHPVVSSSEPGEKWLWCYVDEAFAEYK